MNPTQLEEVREAINDFYLFAKQCLGLKKDIKLILKSDKQNSKLVLGKTAYYDPENSVITVFITNRHISDILRSFSHELVHVWQEQENKYPDNLDTSDGYAQKDSRMRELEREAYEKGNLCFRDWQDSVRKERGNIAYVLTERSRRLYEQTVSSWGYEKNILAEQKERKPSQLDEFEILEALRENTIKNISFESETEFDAKFRRNFAEKLKKDFGLILTDDTFSPYNYYFELEGKSQNSYYDNIEIEFYPFGREIYKLSRTGSLYGKNLEDKPHSPEMRIELSKKSTNENKTEDSIHSDLFNSYEWIQKKIIR